MPDPDKLIGMALRVWGYKQGEVVSLMIHLGDQLGLYRALRGAGRVTAGQLAANTGLHPRWLQEWLRGQAAGGLLESADGETFELGPEAAALLADEDASLWFAAGAFHGCASKPSAGTPVSAASGCMTLAIRPTCTTRPGPEPGRAHSTRHGICRTADSR